jgi:hypothetical protein
MKAAYRRILLLVLLVFGIASPANAYGRGGGGSRGGGHGGFHGGGFHTGGYGGHGGFSQPSFNRTPSFSMPRTQSGNVGRTNSFNNVSRPNITNRPGASGNVNRFNNYGNVNRITNVNVANRAGWGWHNPYWANHSGWVHGYWNGHYPGYGGAGWGWGFGPGFGWGLGLGAGFGLSSWLFGPMLFNWGYSPYANPYYAGYGGNTVVAGQPVAYDYSQPIDAQSQPPSENVTSQASSTFDAAREAFRNGDSARALDLVDQALRQMPGDPTLHEFRALALFALKRYDEAAAALYAVLSVGPGWDWTTMISLYADPEAYTTQLRALEESCRQNPQAAPARFVLAYHYLTEGFSDAAIAQLKSAVALQPKDQLSAELLQQLERAAQQPPAGTETAQTQPAPAPTRADGAGAAPAGKEGKLEGTWTAQPTSDTAITLSFPQQGRFAWKVVHQGKEQQFTGKFTSESGIFTLVQEPNSNNVMVGNVTWSDDGHFNFKVLGGGPGDPGLSFAKAP